jgi:hypothetical protein
VIVTTGGAAVPGAHVAPQQERVRVRLQCAQLRDVLRRLVEGVGEIPVTRSREKCSGRPAGLVGVTIKKRPARCRRWPTCTGRR